MNADIQKEVKSMFLKSFVYWGNESRLAKKFNEPDLRSMFSELSQLASLQLAKASKTDDQSLLMRLALEFFEVEEEVVFLTELTNWAVVKS